MSAMKFCNVHGGFGYLLHPVRQRLEVDTQHAPRGAVLRKEAYIRDNHVRVELERRQKRRSEAARFPRQQRRRLQQAQLRSLL